MTDHEDVLLLAAKQIGEGLTPSEEAELDAHLATCPSCRSFIAGMRRDDILLRGQLGEVAVAPRVRQRVVDEAYGQRRRFDPRIVLALAATLLLGTIGVTLFAGGQSPATQSPQAVVDPTPSPTPTPSEAPSPSPSLSPSPTPAPPSPPPGTGPFVSAAYVYDQQAPRRDSVVARLEDGEPVGEWTRNQPPTGARNTFAGPITCLVIEGDDAWLAGPATTDTVGDTQAVYIHLHDGGADGAGDEAILWRNNPGQSLTTLEGWCRTKFIPEPPFPITAGDIVVDDGTATPSP